MLLTVHIAAGGLAIVLGAVALSVKKGGTLHRRSGLLFVGAMLVMGTTASILGFLKSPTDGNVLAGFMTAYFVGTALTTVRPVSRWTRGINVAALVVAVGLALIDIVTGVKAFNSPHGFLNGVPFLMFFFLATVLTLAAAGDVRIMRSGMPRGRPRLARHLWRMCFALFIAAGSFFSIRAVRMVPRLNAPRVARGTSSNQPTPRSTRSNQEEHFFDRNPCRICEARRKGEADESTAEFPCSSLTSQGDRPAPRAFGVARNGGARAGSAFLSVNPLLAKITNRFMAADIHTRRIFRTMSMSGTVAVRLS
jgi:uncharacterized membrane protein